SFVLRFEDAPSGRGRRSRGLGSLRDDPHAGLGHLEEAERWIRGRVLEMEHADLADDPVAAPGPLDLDDAVEGLVERRELRAGVHFFFDRAEARELVTIEL